MSRLMRHFNGQTATANDSPHFLFYCIIIFILSVSQKYFEFFSKMHLWLQAACMWWIGNTSLMLGTRKFTENDWWCKSIAYFPIVLHGVTQVSFSLWAGWVAEFAPLTGPVRNQGKNSSRTSSYRRSHEILLGCLTAPPSGTFPTPSSRALSWEYGRTP